LRRLENRPERPAAPGPAISAGEHGGQCRDATSITVSRLTL